VETMFKIEEKICNWRVLLTLSVVYSIREQIYLEPLGLEVSGGSVLLYASLTTSVCG